MMLLRPHCRHKARCVSLQHVATHGYVAMSSCASTSSGTQTVLQQCRTSARRAASWCLHCAAAQIPCQQLMAQCQHSLFMPSPRCWPKLHGLHGMRQCPMTPAEEPLTRI